MERLTCKKENGLFCVLASFQGVTEIKDEKEKLSSLTSQFEAIANARGEACASSRRGRTS